MLTLFNMRIAAQLLMAFSRQLAQLGHRRLVLLDGTKSWQKQWLTELISTFTQTGELQWQAYGQPLIEGPHIHAKQYRHQLGTENALIIYSDESFHPDAFAALSGTLIAGGLFIWCCQSEINNDPFQQRLLHQALADEQTLHITEALNHVALTEQLKLNAPSRLAKGVLALAANPQSLPTNLQYHCLTVEQQNVVEGILNVVNGHRDRPLVLTADRGRGKSTTLANACITLLQRNDRPIDIIVTAPHTASLAIFFAQIAKVLDINISPNFSIEFLGNRLRYMPIDLLLNQSVSTPSLLVVDEAAGIPVYCLEALLARFHRIVFSSTVHGYEGAGRGFAIAFTKILALQTPHYSSIQLSKPIRWAEYDPLEQFVFKGFCLDARLTELSDVTSDRATIHYQAVRVSELRRNEKKLTDILALLVTAHYQTSPSDLKLILNNPSVKIFTAYRHLQLIGVVLAIEEGQAKAKDIEAVLKSERHLKNQFLPQALFKQCGFESAFEYRYLRIMRIAVHPQRQKLGIGRALLNFVETTAKQQDYDMLGTCFGAACELTRFWMNAEFLPARLGVQKDMASGFHSLLLLKGLSQQGAHFAEQARQQFYRAFPYLLGAQFSDLDAQLVTEIYQQVPENITKLANLHDLNMIQAYAFAQKQLADSLFSIAQWLPSTMKTATDIDLTLLIKVVWQRQSIETLQANKIITGKKQLNQLLQQALCRLLS